MYAYIHMHKQRANENARDLRKKNGRNTEGNSPRRPQTRRRRARPALRDKAIEAQNAQRRCPSQQTPELPKPRSGDTRAPSMAPTATKTGLVSWDKDAGIIYKNNTVI